MALGMQLAEVRLYSGARRLPIVSAVAVDADGASSHVASHVADGNLNTKWADAAILGHAGASTVELTLDAPAEVSAYELVTASDWPQRDPTSWALWALMPGAPAAAEPPKWALLDAQLPYAARPPARLSTYGRLQLPLSLGRPDSSVGRLRTCGAPVVSSGAAAASSGAAASRRFPGGAPPPRLASPWHVELIPSAGAPRREARRELPSLGELEGEVWAVRASDCVAALLVYDQPAFAGRVVRLEMGAEPGGRAGAADRDDEGACALPPGVRRAARSLRVLLRADGETAACTHAPLCAHKLCLDSGAVGTRDLATACSPSVRHACRRSGHPSTSACRAVLS